MAINETIVTGRKIRRWLGDKWERISPWSKAEDVEADNGLSLETNVGAIHGISSSSTANSDNIAASTALTNQIISDLGGVRFAQDEEGNWGYLPSGADAVIPFRRGQIIKTLVGSFKNAATLDCTSLPNYTDLTLDNFSIIPTEVTSVGGEAGYSGGGQYGRRAKKYTPSIIYDNVSGTLTIKGVGGTYNTTYGSGEWTVTAYSEANVTANVYCIQAL